MTKRGKLKRPNYRLMYLGARELCLDLETQVRTKMRNDGGVFTVEMDNRAISEYVDKQIQYKALCLL